MPSPHIPEEAVEFRISWESPNPHQVNAVEARHGKHCWPRLHPYWPSMDWNPVERITADEKDAWDQYETLKGWEQTHEDPVRNCRLAKRQPGKWEPADV